MPTPAPLHGLMRVLIFEEVDFFGTWYLTENIGLVVDFCKLGGSQFFLPIAKAIGFLACSIFLASQPCIIYLKLLLNSAEISSK